MTISRWQASVSQQRRAWDIDTARALVRDAAGHLDVAAVYKLDELRTAIDRVAGRARPAWSSSPQAKPPRDTQPGKGLIMTTRQ